MAIVVERVEGSKDLIKTYSDTGMIIRQDQTGREYASAIDVETTGYTYTETDKSIKDTEEKRKKRMEKGMSRPINRSPFLRNKKEMN